MNTLAEKITRASGSNLALAFVSLPKRKRIDITTFYAFCRIVDDLADSPGLAPAQKRSHLALWRNSLRAKVDGEHALAPAVRTLIADYQIAPELFEEIIAGVEMDIDGARYATFEELGLYCYRVASAVGLVSIEIFGYTNPRTKEYAVALGMALQITNILRDVHQDFQNQERIYLPHEDLLRFGVSPSDLAAKNHSPAFLALMRFEAARALDFYEKAEALLPAEDRKNLLPAEIMRRVYKRLLARMQNDNFRVFEKRYRLTKLEKLLLVSTSIFASFFRGPAPTGD